MGEPRVLLTQLRSNNILNVWLVVQAKERRHERMSQQNQSIAEELQKQRAAKTRQEVEVS